MKTIDVCNNYAGAGHLQAFYESKNAPDFNIIPLAISLSIGDISKLSNEKIDTLLAATNEDTIVRIWSSQKNNNDYLTVLFICDLLKTKTPNIHVVFTTDLDESIHSINSIDGNKIEALISHEKTLSPDEIDNYSAEWKKLVATNSDLRILENDTVIAKNFSDYDDAILDELAQLSPCTKAHLIAKMLVNGAINGADDATYDYLVERLITNQQIETIQKNDGQTWLESKSA